MIETITLHLADHIFFFLIGLLLPFRTMGAQRKLKDIQFDSRMRKGLYIGNSIGLWLLALVVLALWWWFDRPWSSLGLSWTREAASGWSIGIIIFFFLLYLADTFRDLFTVNGRQEVESRLSRELNILPRQTGSYLFFIPLAFSAGICEEIVFRGFFITYFVSLLGDHVVGQALAVAVPAIIFGIVHTYQGRQAILKIVVMALIFGVIYLFTGSIYLLILLHVIVDLIGGSVGLFFPETIIPDDQDWSSSQVVWEEE